MNRLQDRPSTRSTSALRPLLTDVGMALRALRRLPGYLRHPLTVTEAHEIVAARLESRESDFLDLARRAIFEYPASPYRTLLHFAGCAYGDLERLVRQAGVEGALRTLCRAGVYLTVDEFKGRRPVIRGSTQITVDPAGLRNPLSVPHLRASTGGSRGVATSVQLDLACVRDRAVNMYLALDARGGAQWRTAIWSPRGVIPLLWYSACGAPAARWFVEVDPAALGPWSRFRWSARLVIWTSRLARVALPSPEYAPIDATAPIIAWIRNTLDAGDVPHLWGSPSSIVRLCRAAERAGVDFAGARFTITGEPITEARLAAIRRVHGDAMPDYGSVDSGGTVAYGCLAPDAPDDVHVFRDLNAVIHAEAPVLPAEALLISSLRPSAPFILLNVSMGDRATLTERRCGCPMERLGWGTHLHSIRSFEKLTAGGMTFHDTDVVRILEEVLPQRFGGGPTDYQIIEDAAAEDGQPRLRLLVHPSIGPIDPAAVSDTFLHALGRGGEHLRQMAIQWKQAGFLRVEREAPRRTGAGKILHLMAAPSRDQESRRDRRSR